MAARPHRDELSCSRLIYGDVSEVDTWPYNPSDTLKQALQTDCLSPDELLRLKDEEYRLIGECVNQFSEKQKTAIGWILAATIGVLGNLAVTLGFGPLSFSGNIAAMLAVLVVLSMLVFIYFLFLQKVSIELKFIGPNVSFQDLSHIPILHFLLHRVKFSKHLYSLMINPDAVDKEYIHIKKAFRSSLHLMF